jgi:3'-phosphoadenosine 5'-phosphosulfate sulfotransferase (PAPS reductase)/FAD synthetase
LATIHVDSEEVKNIEEKLKGIAQISTNNYVSDTFFEKSQGKSVDSFNALLDIIVACAKQMETIFLDTCYYLDEVIEQFQFVENEFDMLFNSENVK